LENKDKIKLELLKKRIAERKVGALDNLKLTMGGKGQLLKNVVAERKGDGFKFEMRKARREARKNYREQRREHRGHGFVRTMGGGVGGFKF